VQKKSFKVTGDLNEEQEERRMAFTLKRLIRQLHISEPVEHVMSLLGKRYPETSEKFYLSRLPGVFDGERAGKRMKLPTPETWETQISLKGNKAVVWQQLIDNKKLPFMAMLRNLRNMIRTGISEKHHQIILKKLQDEGAVTYSRQFPFRFFSAYQILDDMEKEFLEWCKSKEITGDSTVEVKRKSRKNKGPKSKSKLTPAEKAKLLSKKEFVYDLHILNRYRKALDCSVKIATQHNVQPIPGKTFVFVNLSDSMQQPCQAAKGLGKPRTRAEIGLLLGLMCKSACEHCRLIGYTSETNYEEIEQLNQQTILENMSKILENPKFQHGSSSSSCIPTEFLNEVVPGKQWFDTIIVVSDGIKSDTPQSDKIYKFLQAYRYLVNPDLMFVSIDLSISDCSVTKSDRFNNRNDIFLSGFSDSLLQFIAERGNDGQLLHVENIDNAYDLNKTLTTTVTATNDKSVAVQIQRPLPIPSFVPKWRTVRVFISSTFKDMHAERDLLIRYIFPELRYRAKSLFVNLYEIDLRWGIAESQSKQSVYLCLNEVLRSEYFIGLVGERYGYVPSTYDVPKNDKNFAWLKNVPIGSSITDLEIQCGALNDKVKKQAKAFFYIRDGDYLKDVPKPWNEDFQSETAEAEQKIQQLKQRIVASGLETYNGYPCRWGGVANDRPVVTGLDFFAQRVINNLWTSLEKEYKPQYTKLDDDSIEDFAHLQYRQSFADHFVSREKVIQQAKQCIARTPLVLVKGHPGSGKSAVIAAIVDALSRDEKLKTTFVYEHYVGVTRASYNSVAMLRRLLCKMVNDCDDDIKSKFNTDDIHADGYTELCTKFASFLHARSVHYPTQQYGPLVLCFDGIEHLNNDTLSHTLNFIPKDINGEDITIFISATDGTDVEKACKQYSSLIHTINVTTLELLERSDIIRSQLDRFGKKLDEQAFSPQMRLITGKHDSFKPSYLTLICEELMLMVDYEAKITEKLKTIPQREKEFIIEIFIRLESLFDEWYVQLAFGLLYSAREDLNEDELRQMINISHSLKKEITFPPVIKLVDDSEQTTPAQLADFLHNCHRLLKPQLYDGPRTVSIATAQIKDIVKSKYVRTNEQQHHFYRIMAYYYWLEAGPSWTSMNVKAFEHLPYYLYSANEHKFYVDVLTDLNFLASKSRVGLVQSLIDDYEITIQTQIQTSFSKLKTLTTPAIKTNDIRLQQYRTFVQRNSHILAVNPLLIHQQALNELESSHVWLNIKQILLSNNSKENIQAFVRVNKQDNMEQMNFSIEDFTEPIRCLAISPSGLLLAAGSADCLVRLYNISTSRLIKSFIGHAAPISSLSFCGNDHLCSGSNDGGLSVWDVEKGHRMHVLTPKHDKCVSELCSNIKGTQFASVSFDSVVRIWSVKTGKKETEIRLHPKPVSCVAFQPDGFMIVTGCWDSLVRQWNVATGQRRSVMRGHLTSIRGVSYSADSRYIASVSIDGECRIWNALAGSQVGIISARISSLYFSPNGSTLTSAGEDGRVRVWSSNIGQCQMTISEPTWGSVSSVVIHPDGELIVAGYHSGFVRLFNMQGGTVEYEINNHTARINRLAFSPSGKILITASGDRTCRLYNVAEIEKKGNDLASTLLKGHTGGVLSCAIGKLNMAATGSEDSTIQFYNIQRFSERPVLEPKQILTDHRAPVTGISFSTDGTQMASSSRDCHVHIWSVSKYSSEATLINTLAHCHADWINDIALNNTNSMLVTASNDNTLKLWNTLPKSTASDAMETTTVQTEDARIILKGHQGSVNTVKFAYGCIVSGSLDNTIRVWSHRGTEITVLRGHEEKITCCDLYVKLKGIGKTEITDDEQNQSWSQMVDEQESKLEKTDELSRTTHTVEQMLIASASEDGTIKIWRPNEPEQIACMDAHSKPINDVVVSNDSILTSSLDNTIRSWQMPSQKKFTNSIMATPQVPEPTSHLDEVTSICVSRDCSLIFTSSRDAYVHIWKVENDSDSSAKRFKIIQSINVHSNQILHMALVQSTSNKNCLITCSVDKTIKSLFITTNNDNKCIIKRENLFSVNGVVSFISGHFDMPYFVIGESPSLSNLNFFLCSSTTLGRLKYYKSNTCQYPLCSSITLDQNKQCILTVGDINGQLSFFNLTLIANTDTKILQSYSKQIETTIDIKTSNDGEYEWATSIEAENGYYIGTTAGNVYYSSSNTILDRKQWVKLSMANNGKSITGICSLNNQFLFTCGHDNMIKVQNINDYYKNEKNILGHYPVPAPLTKMRSWNQNGIVASDNIGNLYLVIWYH
ncbi:unnamed protein product, partial [Didymodactylos carnosus]